MVAPQKPWEEKSMQGKQHVGEWLYWTVNRWFLRGSWGISLALSKDNRGCKSGRISFLINNHYFKGTRDSLQIKGTRQRQRSKTKGYEETAIRAMSRFLTQTMGFALALKGGLCLSRRKVRIQRHLRGRQKVSCYMASVFSIKQEWRKSEAGRHDYVNLR